MSNESKTNKELSLNWLKILLPISSTVSLVLWLYIRVKSSGVNHSAGDYFALSLAVTPLIAGCLGFGVARDWGGKKSLLGRAILALSTGLVLWALGNFIWAYYNLVQHVEVPYPSVADVGYGLSVLFWILCTIYLGRALGVSLLLRKKPRLKWLAIVFALTSVVVSYLLFVIVAPENGIALHSNALIKAFFDLYYPLTDIVSLLVITLVFVVSGRYVGGLLRLPVLVIGLGMLSSYVYDLTFSYSTTKGFYQNGQASDILLLIATVALSSAIALFGMRAAKLQGTP